MKVPLLDLKAQYASIKTEVDAAIIDLVASQQFILGPKVRECEEALAAYTESAFAIGVSSGTDAILMCLMDLHVGPGDEVITSPYTFFATVGCIARLGATAVFVDIDPVSYNIDPAQIEARITERTKAIIPVHLYGQMADMDAIRAIAQKHGVAVIEDAAQAIGARRNGASAGSIGEYGCFSFFPSKNLGGFGDAGLVVTNDAGRAERLRLLRGHGAKPKYYHKIVGGNFRIDALQAVVVQTKLRYLDEWTAARQRNAAYYRSAFAENDLMVAETASYDVQQPADVYLPSVVTERHVFNQFVVRVPHRDELRAYLEKRGVGTEVYYPVPMHLQECFRYLGYTEGDMPESERAANETLALPIYAELQPEQIDYVAETIATFLKEHRAEATAAVAV